MWKIVATVAQKRGNTMLVRQIPTFYLGSIQGVTNKIEAQRVASDIINPFMLSIEIDMEIEKV